MKKIIYVLLSISILSACGLSKKFSKSGVEEKKVVSEFLDYMVDGASQNRYRSFIAPSYAKENDIDIYNYRINTYSPVDYKIISYDRENGLITTHIWGEDRSWVHELVFKLVKEHNKIYLYPKKHTDSYIHPWYKSDQWIEK